MSSLLPLPADDVPRGVDADTGNELSFKDKVKVRALLLHQISTSSVLTMTTRMVRKQGYAKLNAGSITHNSKEKAQGEALLRGEDIGQKH